VTGGLNALCVNVFLHFLFIIYCAKICGKSMEGAMSIRTFLSDYYQSVCKEVGKAVPNTCNRLCKSSIDVIYRETDCSPGKTKGKLPTSMRETVLKRAAAPFKEAYRITKLYDWGRFPVDGRDKVDGQGKMVVNFIKQGRSPIRLIIGAVAMIVTLVKAIVLCVVYFVLFALSAWIGRPLYKRTSAGPARGWRGKPENRWQKRSAQHTRWA